MIKVKSSMPALATVSSEKNPKVRKVMENVYLHVQYVQYIIYTYYIIIYIERERERGSL